tara:strand:+ start:2293 stop:3624 length:1332 start_codon:yes stop_codon:yes gene_type:complete
MKTAFTLIAVLALSACSGETGLPDPTGKGTVRAINAIPASQEIAFRIEERLLESISYKSGSSGVRYDDFEYTFNFDASFLGETSTRRIASLVQKIDNERDYTFVVTGDIAAPDITVWTGDERAFSGTETVFEVRYAHLAESLGPVDIYLAAEGVAPAAGNAVATLDYLEVLPAMDVEADEYVLTITSSGDPADIVYQSNTISYVAQRSYIVPVFTGDEMDAAPYTVRLIPTSGTPTSLPDARFAPTARFMQMSASLAAADIYDDEMLTSLVLENQSYGDISDDIPIAATTTTFSYTPTGNTGAVLFEDTIVAVSGSHYNFIVTGDDSDRDALVYAPDRRAVSSYAKLSFVHVSKNHEILDVYIVDSGAGIDDASPIFILPYRGTSNGLPLAAGTYDLYITANADQTILAGPVELNLALGDVVESLLVDAVDPAIAEIRIVPQP